MTTYDQERNLLSKLNEGDSAVISEIYSLYASQLFSFARRNIHSREDCEEIVQDVFLSLWARHKSVEIQSLKHYLFNAVRYKVIRYFQHSTVKAKYEAHYRHFESCIYEQEEERTLEPDQIRERILEHLNPLPERCQQAFTLRIRENLSNSEIADRMNITKKTVELYMFKALAHLRAQGHKILNPDN